MQQEVRVDICRLFLYGLVVVEVPHDWTGHVEKDCVKQVAKTDENTDDLGHPDYVAVAEFSLAGLLAKGTPVLALVVLGHAIEAVEEAQEDGQDAELVDQFE